MTAPTAPVARPVELLTAFSNTVDAETGHDALDSRAALTRWLHEHRLLARRTPSTEADLALARRLRDGLREAWRAHHDGRVVESADLVAATTELPLRINCCGTGPRLEPVDSGVRGALAQLLVAVNETVISGDWERLKICADDTCQWAYHDATNNRSKNWCGDSCSNRAKTRSYRQRKKSLAPGEGAGPGTMRA